MILFTVCTAALLMVACHGGIPSVVLSLAVYVVNRSIALIEREGDEVKY